MSELRTSNKTLEHCFGHFNFAVLDTQKSIYFIPAGSWFYKHSIKTYWNNIYKENQLDAV